MIQFQQKGMVKGLKKNDFNLFANKPTICQNRQNDCTNYDMKTIFPIGIMCVTNIRLALIFKFLLSIINMR